MQPLDAQVEGISTILPNITYQRGDVKIIEGVFLEGRLTKKDVGKSNGSINHVIYNDIGPDACVSSCTTCRDSHIVTYDSWIHDRNRYLVRSQKPRSSVKPRERLLLKKPRLEDPNARLNACRSIMGKAVIGYG